jgi:formylglycine-generating enzyme required for sulfatase activity
VASVTLAEAEAFLVALNQRLSGINARLPSEAEWEYACRAGGNETFAVPITAEQLLSERALLTAWENQPIDAPTNWEAMESALRGIDGATQLGPRPVNIGQRNAWGLSDLHGNLQEWCRDRWDHRSGYALEAAVDPLGNSGQLAVVRGGSWLHPAERARSASRYAQDPEIATAWVGFRFVVPGGAVPEALPTEP